MLSCGAWGAPLFQGRIRLLHELLMLFWTICSLLTFCAFAESVSGRTRYSILSRARGALFTFLMPITGLFIGISVQRLWGIGPVLSLVGLPVWATVMVLLLLRDFFNYWEHRFEHALLWSVHSVHHAETELHAANDYSHPISAIFEIVLIVFPMLLIDTGGIGIPAVISIAATMRSKLNHSPLRVDFGPFWRVMVDHRFHRIHHSVEARHFGKNFGTVFTFWDQLFGTAYFPAKDEWPDVGLLDRNRADSLVGFLLWPLRGQRDSQVAPIVAV